MRPENETAVMKPPCPRKRWASLREARTILRKVRTARERADDAAFRQHLLKRITGCSRNESAASVPGGAQMRNLQRCRTGICFLCCALVTGSGASYVVQGGACGCVFSKSKRFAGAGTDLGCSPDNGCRA